MTDDLVRSYNYDAFVPEKFERYMTFDTSPPLGEPGPDFPLWSRDGEASRLSTILKDARYTIVEFGSFT